MVTIEEALQQIGTAEEQVQSRRQEIAQARARAEGIQVPPGTIGLQFALRGELGGAGQALQRLRIRRTQERQRAFGQVAGAQEELSAFESRIQEQRGLVLEQKRRVEETKKARALASERAQTFTVARRLAGRGASVGEIRQVTGVKAIERPIDEVVGLERLSLPESEFKTKFFPGVTLEERDLFFVEERTGTRIVVGELPGLVVGRTGEVGKETRVTIPEFDIQEPITIPGAAPQIEFQLPDLVLDIQEQPTTTKGLDIPAEAFGGIFVSEPPTRLEKLRQTAFISQTRGEATAGGIGFIAGAGASLVGGARFIKQLATEPLETFGETLQAIPELPGTLGRAGAIIRQEPSFATGFVAGELVQLRVGQIALTKGRDIIDIGRTRISPGFRPVERDVIIGIPSEQQFFFERPGLTIKGLAGEDISLFGARVPGTFDIPIAPPVSRLGIPLMEQAEVAGKRVTAISAQVGFPALDIPLDRTFFADPFGRLRVSRFGLTDDIAGIQDIFSSEISFRRGARQAFIFEDVGVAPLPRDIAESFRIGRPLTTRQTERFTQFQERITGEFKPIGKLSTEPEIILGTGEIIRKVEDLGATLISPKSQKFFDLPKRVQLIRTEVVQPTARTSQLLGGGILTSKEQAELFGRLSKETGFDIGDISSPLRGTKFIPPEALGISISSQVRRRVDISSAISLPRGAQISSLGFSPKELSKQLSGFSRQISIPKGISGISPTTTFPSVFGISPPSSPFKPLKEFATVIIPPIKISGFPEERRRPVRRRKGDRAKKKGKRRIRGRPFSPDIAPSFSAIVLDLKGALPTGEEFFGGRAGVIPGLQFRFVPTRRRTTKKKTKTKRRTQRDLFRGLTDL